ncbi:hydroxymethylglutaryl-CoA reductase [Hymenobacter sp. 5516J-16]|uniref:hydroxymethylglutaryl-CoA reductase (NADPH) n=1 Tax=Hymenobacter sublimis TaxID=2933777 RepID=A0ABY4J7R8_9BACT|nr:MULTISPECIES: hydroxymethylglutaryl-CoA reductase [Hymenobacter]UOQ78895.1 hydroxymethylglutaryl-CoA reductase [Hymenobacter sp. 5516J-16]UPL48853.1 hydroxymethylglutaryl-CoA reductase [Hymenobacter sublimis]
MLFTPSPMLLKLLYTRGSLHNTPEGVAFSIKNRLDTVRVTRIDHVRIGDTLVPAEQIALDLGDGNVRPATVLNADGSGINLPVGQTATFHLATRPLKEGMHTVQVQFAAEPFGDLTVEVEDAIAQQPENRTRIPRSEQDDYSEAAIQARQQFAEEFTGQQFEHLKQYSFDAHALQGNCEHFTGVAQIPVGLAGPLRVNGEHAQGDFLIPMATTEGTLVASYNRGMQVLNLCGGVKCTVIGDAMQRAPVFVFDDARGARDFGQWVAAEIERIRPEAESTSRVAKLQYIDTYLANKFAYLRFNFSTGDAAGQNMVGRATFAACSWILENYKGAPIRHFYLESNFATDKKASQINVMRTRGKRVVAECVIKRDILQQRMRVTPEQLAYHGQVSNVGAFLSGANNNGAHSANGITALFIATGQDVANVSESSAGVLYSEVTKEGDLYLSITIPSLIVATHGGGTGLATQNECLRMLNCVGRGTVNKFAEIVAGVVLAGELSLGSAISSSDWVSSHEQYGRNR